ncbi:MAG: Outer membrane protein PagN [Candidatus Erwinia impunctatus]|nr:Outer membrane protein PagN [Culicoides impunctatus]
MKIITFVSLAALTLPASLLAATTDEGYYAAARYLNTQQRAADQDTSSRPGVGQFTEGKTKQRSNNLALAFGYQFGNGWRSEAEYVLRKSAEYTSGSTAFPTSENHLQTHTTRVMLNVYRDYALRDDVSLYATAGLGVSKITAEGWQGNSTRQYAEATNNNLTWGLGAGISYSPVEHLSLDAGYRYTDMGNISSGYNQFTNVRRLKDEQMKARLTNSEWLLGARYLF